MNLKKFGPLDAGITIFTDKRGQEHILAVAKITFSIGDDGACTVSDEPRQLVTADEFYGEPGLSATLYDSDYAPIKPRCDILINCAAYAPSGRPAASVPIRAVVGPMTKSFNVVVDRTWSRKLFSISSTAPIPFSRMPINYARAYGGIDTDPSTPEKTQTFVPNPVGVGYYPLTRGDAVVGKSLQNTEALGSLAPSINSTSPPLALGAIGRNFPPRVQYAGTYDQTWIDNVFPFLPADFDDRYHQSAPPEQQIEHPREDLLVELTNLTPDGRLAFLLPHMHLPVKILYKYREEDLVAVTDTIVIEPDERRCTITARASTPLIEKLSNVYEVWVGVPSPARVRALGSGKAYISRDGS